MNDNPFGFQWNVVVTTRTRRGPRKMREFTRIRGRWHDSANITGKQLAGQRDTARLLLSLLTSTDGCDSTKFP